MQRAVGNRSVQRLLAGRADSVDTPQRRHPGVPVVAGGPSIQRFSAGPHEQMSASALSGAGYGRREMEDIQLGNWATDMNQISLIAPHLQRVLGFQLTPEEQFRLVQLVAVGHFGERVAGRMTRDRLGSYQPSEHFDNPPAEANTARQPRPVARHIAPGGGLPADQTGIGRIEGNLTLAISAGRTSAGLQHYGRAVHITEDFFAHTNFVRIAMRVLDSREPEPYGGRVEGLPEGRYQLTSGIFAQADTVMSILHLLLEEVLKEPEPGRTTAGDRIILMILNHVSPALEAVFRAHLNVRNRFSRVSSAIASALGIQQARALARLRLQQAISRAMSAVGGQVTGTGTQPSHTRMNVDDPASGGDLYPIARALAVHVVAQIDPLVRAAWAAPAGREQEAARQAVFDRLRGFLIHPQDGDWWRPIVQSGSSRRAARPSSR